jgi:protein phosphatase
MLQTKYRQVQVAMASDCGLVRSENQDACLLLPEDGLFILADGMGGHQAGALAARRVIEQLPQELAWEINRQAGFGRTQKEAQRQQALQLAIQRVSRQIQVEGSQDQEKQGMGSTLVMVWLQQQLTTIAHVGDSRVYLWRDGRLQALTVDHTVGNALLKLNQVTPEDIETNITLLRLSRCMGMAGEVDPDISQLVLKENDRLLLCSDGLTTMVAEEEIAAIIGRKQEPEAACDALVKAANDAGGRDNVSVILIHQKPGW